MSLWNVQSVEIIIIRLDLTIVLYRVAHRNENVLDMLPQDRDRMQVAGPHSTSRQRYIELVSLDLGVSDKAFDRLFGHFQSRNYLALDRLDQLAKRTSPLGRNLADQLQRSRDSGLFAGVADLQIAKLPHHFVGRAQR